MASQGKGFRILGVGTDEFQSDIRALLTGAGYKFDSVRTPDEMKKLARGGLKNYDSIITDSDFSIDLPIREEQTEGIEQALNFYSSTDPFIPVIVFSRKKKDVTVQEMVESEQTVARIISNGAYYVSNLMPNWRNELKGNLANILRRDMMVGPVDILKFGGSLGDFDAQTYWRNLMYATDIVDQLHENGNRLIGTVGAGVDGLEINRFCTKYTQEDGLTKLLDNPLLPEIVRYTRPSLMELALKTHAKKVISLLYHGKYMEPQRFFEITKDLLDRIIPFITLAPPCILRKKEIPLDMSDWQTIEIGRFYRARKAVFLKRAGRFYDFDPLQGYTLDPETCRCADYDKFRSAQEKNNWRTEVTVDYMLERMNRYGCDISTGEPDGTQEHLVETGALHSFRDSKLDSIILVPAAEEEMYIPVSDGWGEHVHTGEKIQMPDPRNKPEWAKFTYGLLERCLTEAIVNGNGSKILKK